MVRSIFRMIEYAEGKDGILMKREIYVYVLDSSLMFIVIVLFSVYHPSSVLVGHSVLNGEPNLPQSTDSYAMLDHGRRDTRQWN